MPQSNKTDNQLVIACLAGDAQSWDALIERHRGLIYSIARKMGLPRTDADDIFQNVCITLFNHLKHVREVDRLSGWLSRTTSNEVIHLFRVRSITTVRDTLESETGAERNGHEYGIPSSLPEEVLMAMEQKAQMRRSMELLPDDCRRLLTELYTKEHSYDQAARNLSLPLGSIGPSRMRCLSKLKKIYDKLDR